MDVRGRKSSPPHGEFGDGEIIASHVCFGPDSQPCPNFILVCFNDKVVSLMRRVGYRAIAGRVYFRLRSAAGDRCVGYAVLYADDKDSIRGRGEGHEEGFSGWG